jgi:hypothetical protein
MIKKPIAALAGVAVFGVAQAADWALAVPTGNSVRDWRVLATGIENAGDYRAKGYTKEQYDQYLAEQVRSHKLDDHAFLLWNEGAAIAYRSEYANARPNAVAAKVYAHCITP